MPSWPVTRRQALAQLGHFTKHALKDFGRWQDAMWTGENFLWHAHLAPAMNIKLLDPREVIQAAIDAWQQGDVPIESAEGFIRQVLGWREFVHGIYWTQGEDYPDRNTLAAVRPLPEAYWTGSTDMVCIGESVAPVLEHAYSHHIQRLMVTGTFAMMAGIDPRLVRDWYLGMFADGVDWVTTPNVIGMSQWADGGIVGSKPYAAGGRYISRMSNYCKTCRFDPVQTSGPEACPMSTLFWNFLDRNQERFRSNHRMGMMLRNLDRQDPERLHAITLEGNRMLDALDRPDLGSDQN
jgi:deoxyribodipyrimidine photolyase-related protein